MAWSRPLAMISLAASLLGSAGCEIRRKEAADAGERDAETRCGSEQDLDLDGDGIRARDEGDGDPDGDGAPNDLDLDSDGDGIPDAIEAGDADCDTAPVDTDGDGTPDFLDLDSDDDTIADAVETANDRDGDGVPNFRDLDTDGDGVLDAVEAGDGSLGTPPASCAVEDPDDGAADFADLDSDGDGLADGEELALGTDPCDLDSDDDGQDDLVEAAYERVNCPDRTASNAIDCGCATDPGCRIPEQHFYVVLAHGESAERDLTFDTSIRRADVFFLIDTTSSMGPTLEAVEQTIATPGTGLVDRISTAIPDAWIGGGEHRDFPFSSYGGEGDHPFRLAIEVSPPARAEAVREAFAALEAGGGGDLPEAQVEALHQVLTGEGATFEHQRGDGARSSIAIPRYAGDCLEGRWGAACFRPAALPLIVLFTDVCARGGPAGEAAGCGSYEGVSPAPASWEATVATMQARGARFIGVNTSSVGCAGAAEPAGAAPCFFLRRTAEATGSVDLEGAPLVYDLPGTADRETFVDTIALAITRMATRVPLDVDTVVRDDPTDAAGVDARAFVGARIPACRAGSATCWEAPRDVPHEAAVGALEAERFLDVVPGTRVTFRVSLRNETRIGGPRSEVHVAFIDVRGEGTAVLDTRQVYVVVPADDEWLPG